MTRKRDNGAGSLYRETARNRWVGEVVLDGRKRRVMARTKTDAAAKLARLIRDHEGGTVALDGAATVATATAVWRERVLPGHGFATSTVKLYRWALDLLDAELGPVRLRDLDAARIEKALDRLTAGSQGRPLGRRSLDLVRSTLAQVLDTAQRRKLIGSNPARVAELTASAARPKGKRSLDIEGSRRLWAALAEEGSSGAACLQLQLVTGLRPGEAAGVCWDALDLDAGHLNVRRSARRDDNGVAQLAAGLKTSSSYRTIGLPAPAVELLRGQRAKVAALKLAAREWVEQDLAFPSTTGRPLDPSNQRRLLAQVLDAAGLPRLTPNELRHTAATVMSDQGVPLELIADVLGHSSTRMLDATYRHRIRPAADAAVAVMDGLFGAAERS